MESGSPEPTPLGVIIAGGRSRRFGAPKALARVGGRRIVVRVRDALEAVLPRVVMITNEPALFDDLDLDSRPDVVEGAGPLGGIHAALRWAEEEGRPGALCVACDLPFVTAPLLRGVWERARRSGVAAIVPESRGAGSGEPLCAFYSVVCLPEIEARLERGDRKMFELLDALHATCIPLAELSSWGDPETLFLNVNTPDEYQRAVRIAREREN